MLVYIDTNIVLDAVRDRTSVVGRDLGTPAKSLFSRAAACQFDIVVSEWLLEELDGKVDPGTVQQLFQPLRENDKIVKQRYSAEDKEEAKAVTGHWHDALHGVLAERAGADVLVTRNLDDFRLFTSLDPKLPEQV